MEAIKSFEKADKGWRFIFRNGKIETFKTLSPEIQYIGAGTWSPSIGIIEYLDCSWDFDIYRLCPICVNNKWGFINDRFEYEIKCKYDFAGICIDYCHNQHLHYYFWNSYELNEKGHEPFSKLERKVKPFCCPVLLGNKWLQIDVNGNEFDFDDFNVYKEALSRINTINISGIIEMCHELLPLQWKPCPWKHPELIHGIGLLASDEALNCYMSAYGDMHVSKCRAAIMNFPFEKLNGSIEIVDWGCGQGIGTATLVEMLKQRELLSWVKKITLVEPSPYALQRAVYNISMIASNSIEIDAINKFMPTNETVSGEILSSIGYKYSNVIHIFSNILDVKSIDLGNVARMVASSHGCHYILCMGPQNSVSYRIDQFCSVFGEQIYFSSIDSVRYGRTQRTGHPYTCKTRCFVYNGASIDLSKLSLYQDNNDDVYNDYDIQLQWQNKVMSHEKARVAYRLQEILSVDDIMYVDPIVNEVSVDFIIVRPNKGLLLLNVFEENLENCILTKDGKDIIVLGKNGVAVKSNLSPIELINICQTSIKDGIE